MKRRKRIFLLYENFILKEMPLYGLCQWNKWVAKQAFFLTRYNILWPTQAKECRLNLELNESSCNFHGPHVHFPATDTKVFLFHAGKNLWIPELWARSSDENAAMCRWRTQTQFTSAIIDLSVLDSWVRHLSAFYRSSPWDNRSSTALSIYKDRLSRTWPPLISQLAKAYTLYGFGT